MEGRPKSYEDRLRYLGFWTIEERRKRQDLIELINIFKRLSRVRIYELFMLDHGMKTLRDFNFRLAVSLSVFAERFR